MKQRQLEELPALLANKKAVVAHGCFDILRVEHLRFLEAARQRGDTLIVAVYNDRPAALPNGSNPTILSAAERVALISALRCVDYVVAIDEPSVGRMLQLLRPAAVEAEPATSDVVRHIQEIQQS
jgi:D-beta-D-heptose 7-phosphate kinase/D-beta-D-heptose 1-phosphate adenosyltransferase